MLIGEGKTGQAGEKTLSPLPGTHRTLKQPFLTSVKPSPDETRSASAPVLSLPTRAAVHRTEIAAAPPGTINHSDIWLCSSTSAGIAAASPLTRDARQRRRCAAAAHGYLCFGGNCSTLLVFGLSLLIPSDYGVSEGREAIN